MLDSVPVGEEVVLGAFVGLDDARVRRLAELGLRPGVRVRVRRRTAGGGRIVGAGDDRVALARSVLRCIGVATEPAATEPAATGPAATEQGDRTS